MRVKPNHDSVGVAAVSGRTGMESLNTHLHGVHQEIRQGYRDIDRMAIALYDASSATLKTFVSSNASGGTLERHEVKLRDVPSLQSLADSRQSRVVDDMATAFSGSLSHHSQWLLAQHMRSSLTVPVFQGDTLLAFFFFDSRRVKAFDPPSVAQLQVVAQLVPRLYLAQIKLIRSMSGMVHLVSGFSRMRDLETGQHLDRMAKYAQLMARAVAPQYELDDEFIEYVHLFAPLHDVGKIGIPDRVLLKPAALDEEEWTIMRSHVAIGEKLVDDMEADFSLGDSLAFAVMRNVVSCHHERGDGSGYPRGLTMDQIPMEARLIAIADVYDALSTRRPYKPAWSERDCVAELRREAQLGRLDARCVEALIAAKSQRLDIQSRFSEAEILAITPPMAG